MHWANNCPHQDSNNESVNILEQKAPQNELPENYNSFEQYEEINIVLITEEINKNEIFVAEACKSAVVDTACTKTVAGEIWYKTSIDLKLKVFHQTLFLNLVMEEKLLQRKE